MKRIFIAIFLLLILTLSLDAQDKNDFNSFILLNKSFSIASSSKEFNYQESFLKKFQEIDNYQEKYSFKFKSKTTDVAIKLNKLNDEKFDLKVHEKDFVDLKSFSLNITQLWKYNISTSVAYFFKKYSNFKLLNTDFEKKGYSINISKYIKSNKFSISYENIDLSSDKTYEDIFIENCEKNKFTLSYQINLNRKFSIIFLYSLTKYNDNYKDENEDIFFTGFKYKFNFFKNLE